MSSPSTSVRRRIALATGAGALVLLGGAGVAYAASSIDDPSRRAGPPWSTPIRPRPAAAAHSPATARPVPPQDCPDQAGPSQDGPSQDGDL